MSEIINPAVIVGEVQAGEAARIRAELESLIYNVNRSGFDIGSLCYEVKRRGYYYPYTTFKEYSATLPIKPRKIQYLTRIAEVMDRVGIQRTVYEPIGIAKLREITSLEPNEVWRNPETQEEVSIRDFIVGFVDRGNDMSLDDIKQHVRTLKGFVGENDLVWRNFYVTRSAAENTIDPAIQLAKAHLGSSRKDDEGISQDASDGAALEVITIEFLNDPKNNWHNISSLEELEEQNEAQENENENT